MAEDAYGLIPVVSKQSDTNAFDTPSDASNIILFDASIGVLPRAPENHHMTHITFKTCPGSDLRLTMVCHVSKALDRHGLVEDSWWSVECSKVPSRHMRLTRGAYSLICLLKRYGFQDASGCVNHKLVQSHYSNATPCHHPPVTSLVDIKGVPQFFPRSGNCWFTTLCTVSFANEHVQKFICSYMPPEIRNECCRVLYDRDAALRLREYIWHNFRIGDDVNDKPENDGCNGFYEFMVLCAKIKLPLITLREAKGTFEHAPSRLSDKQGRPVVLEKVDPTRPHLLVLRYKDGDHSKRFPIHRRLRFEGRRYKWIGSYAGHRECGHQIGFASKDGGWRNLIIGDADFHKDGIGPVHVQFEGPQWIPSDMWWFAINYITHVTKFGENGTRMCNHSLHNPPKNGKPGMNSIEILYEYGVTPNERPPLAP